MSVKTFDPSLVTVVVNGIPIQGYADGTGVKVARADDAFKKTVGMDSSVTRTKSADKSGTVEITLAQTSLSNPILSAIATIDEAQNGGIVKVAVSDLSGTSLYSADKAWIRKQPDAEFGKTASNRTWIFDCANLKVFHGTNL